MPLVWLPTETDADPTTTIAAPGVSIGVGEVTVTDTASMPPVGYIGWAVIDDEVITVTGAADNPYPIDRAQAGTVEADHAAGAAFNWTVVPATVIALVKEQVTAADVSGLADALATKLDTAALDTDGTLAANSDAKIATQKATKTYANTKLPLSGGTLTGALGIVASSAAAPGLFPSGDSDTGMFGVSANILGFATGGSERLRINAAGIGVTGSVTPTGGIFNGLASSGSTINMTLGTTPGEIEATAASVTVNLASIYWGRTNTPVHIFKDPANICTSWKFYPLPGADFFSANDHNSINEAIPAQAAWIDAFGGTGTAPGGSYLEVTQVGVTMRLSAIRNYPGVSGGAGGYNLDKISDGGI